MQESIPSVDESLARLRRVVDSHITLLKSVMSHHMVPLDMVVIGVTQRSISLIHGFASMVESRNAMCALGLIRMQIDTLMRLYGSTLVADVNQLVTHMLEGRPFYHLKARDGSQLRDAYLRQQLANHFDWVEHAYKFTSEFIHLSGRHIRSTIQPSEGERTLSFFVSRANPDWQEEDVLEAIDYFGKATDGILGLCYQYMLEKECTNDLVDELEDRREAEEAE